MAQVNPSDGRLLLDVLLEKRREVAQLPPVRQGQAWADWFLSFPPVENVQESNAVWSTGHGLLEQHIYSYTRLFILYAIESVVVQPSIARSFVERMNSRHDDFRHTMTEDEAESLIDLVVSHLYSGITALTPDPTHPHSAAPVVNWALRWLAEEEDRVKAVQRPLRVLKLADLPKVQPLLRGLADEQVAVRVRQYVNENMSRARRNPEYLADAYVRKAAQRAGVAGLVEFQLERTKRPPGTPDRIVVNTSGDGNFPHLNLIDGWTARVTYRGKAANYTGIAEFLRTMTPGPSEFAIVGNDAEAMTSMARFIKSPDITFVPLQEGVSDALHLDHGVPRDWIQRRIVYGTPAPGRTWNASIERRSKLIRDPHLPLRYATTSPAKEIAEPDLLAELAEHDPFIVWGAQDLREDARAWYSTTDGVAAAALSRTLWKNRLFVRGEAEAVTRLVENLVNRGLPVQRVWGERETMETLLGELPWLEQHETAWAMHTRRLDGPQPPLPPGARTKWSTRADVQTRTLLSKALTWSYGRHPAPIEEFIQVYDKDRELAAIAALTWPAKGVGFLSAVATDPRKRGQGFGSRAIYDVVQRGLERHGEVLLLVGDEDASAPARRRYEELGMRKRAVMSARPRIAARPGLSS